MASFNLHCGVDMRGAPYDVVATIGQLNAAVTCLQEDWVASSAADNSSDSGRADQVAAAARELSLAVHRAELCATSSRVQVGVHANTGPGRLCVTVLTALPLVGYEVIALGRGIGDSIPRVAQVLLLRLPRGGELRVVNTHLTFSVASPLQLRRLWRRLRADPVPTVIAGDLNMPALVARRYPGLTSVVSGPTFPADQPVVQLDHVLVSEGITVGGGFVLPPAGSDHRPVRVRVELNGRCDPPPGGDGPGGPG